MHKSRRRRLRHRRTQLEADEAFDVFGDEQQHQTEQNHHAHHVDNLLNAVVDATTGDDLDAQKHQATTVESGQRQQVKEAEQRADLGGQLQTFDEALTELLRNHLRDADDADKVVHLRFVTTRDHVRQRHHLRHRQTPGLNRCQLGRRAQSKSLSVGADRHLNADAKATSGILRGLDDDGLKRTAATNLDFQWLTARARDARPHFVDHSDGVTVDAGDDIASLKSRSLGGLTRNELLNHRAGHARKEVNQEEDSDGEDVVYDRTSGDGQKALPCRPVRIRARIVSGNAFVVGIEPSDLHVATEGNGADLEGGLTAHLAKQRGSEANRESVHPHVAHLGDDVVTPLMDDDEDAERQNRQCDIKHGKHGRKISLNDSSVPSAPSRTPGFGDKDGRQGTHAWRLPLTRPACDADVAVVASELRESNRSARFGSWIIRTGQQPTRPVTKTPKGARLPTWSAGPLALVGSLLLGCPQAPTELRSPQTLAPAEVTVALVGTSDLHGYVEPRQLSITDDTGTKRTVEKGGLALFGGYLRNLRQRHPVLLLDGGDLFQGTMVSNLGEGRAVIDGYNALGYTAAAVGNHEFDYGPDGPKSVPSSAADDPTGALKARIASARFPFLSANLIDKKTSQPVDWPNIYPSKIVQVAGISIGLIGAVTEDTPRTTNVLNLRDVQIASIIPAVRAQAEQLRRSGVAAVVLTIHEGANCTDFHDAKNIKPCDNEDGRVLPIARALRDVVDAVVAGHSHAGIAHFVDGVPVIQAFAYGQAFARTDLVFRRSQSGFVLDKTRTLIHPPQELCSVELPPLPESPKSPITPSDGSGSKAASPQRIWRCDSKILEAKPHKPATYEGQPVSPSVDVAGALASHIAKAAEKRGSSLGVTMATRLHRNFKVESPLGQFLADLTRGAAAQATGQPVDLALQNGGGIRNELPAGNLTYGDVFEVLPFDNRLALVKMPGSALIELFRRNLLGSHGILIPSSGIRVQSRCSGGELHVELVQDNGQPIDPTRKYTVATSDFLALGGDNFGAIVPTLGEGAVKVYEDTTLREIIVEELQRYRGPFLGGTTSPTRLNMPMPRPVRCQTQPGAPTVSTSDIH